MEEEEGEIPQHKDACIEKLLDCASEISWAIMSISDTACAGVP